MAIQHDGLGPQRHGAEPQKTSRHVADDRPGDHHEGNDGQVAQNQHQLRGHDFLEHPVDRASEDQGHERQQEDRESQELDETLVRPGLGQMPEQDGRQRNCRVRGVVGPDGGDVENDITDRSSRPARAMFATLPR